MKRRQKPKRFWRSARLLLAVSLLAVVLLDLHATYFRRDLLTAGSSGNTGLDWVPKTIASEYKLDPETSYERPAIYREIREIALENRSQTVKILVLGDSVTDKGTYVQFLSEKLHGKYGDSIRIVNAGVAGYDTELEKAYLETKGLELSPDLVILQINANDFVGTPVFLAKETPGQDANASFSERLFFTLFPLPPIYKQVALQALLVNYFLSGISPSACLFEVLCSAQELAGTDLLNKPLFLTSLTGETHFYSGKCRSRSACSLTPGDLQVLPNLEPAEKLKERVKKPLGDISSILAERNITFVPVYFPVFAENQLRDGTYQLVLSIIDELHLEEKFIDLTPAYAGLPLEDIRTDWFHPSHPRGYEIAAGQIFLRISPEVERIHKTKEASSRNIGEG